MDDHVAGVVSSWCKVRNTWWHKTRFEYLLYRRSSSLLGAGLFSKNTASYVLSAITRDGINAWRTFLQVLDHSTTRRKIYSYEPQSHSAILHDWSCEKIAVDQHAVVWLSLKTCHSSNRASKWIYPQSLVGYCSTTCDDITHAVQVSAHTSIRNCIESVWSQIASALKPAIAG